MKNAEEGMIIVRCMRTGNPSGTDILPKGTHCGCNICEAVKFGREEFRAAGIEAVELLKTRECDHETIWDKALNAAVATLEKLGTEDER